MIKSDLKKTLIVAHDLVVTALAVLATFVVRFEGTAWDERVAYLPAFLPFFVLYAGLVYWFCHLYRSKWRFASLPDLFNIFRASGILALTLLIADYILVSPQLFGFYFFGKVAIALYWLVQMALLGGPRLAFRYFKYARSRHTIERDATTPTLLLGRGSDIDMVLRAVEGGSVKKIQPKGILSHRPDDVGQSMRGVPVLGGYDDLDQVVQDFRERGVTIRRLVATPSALAPEAHPEALIARARRLGIPLSRLKSLGDGMREAELAPLEIEDLLLRPTVQIDRGRLERFMQGKRVLVTGGGGSIGAEICTRVAAFGASDLLILDSSEPSLHNILENPALLTADTRTEGVIADVRDRERTRQVMLDFKPDVVFHAAALKHVPYLEKDWAEGIKTNVFGSINVADAAVEAGVQALVNISTDKAIEPVSMLGVTKRFAEIYAQALDAEFMGRSGATRLISVRFGNVLGSAGSVVPKFKAQIARGGPVTVTHPDMVRYFMTIREACDLVLTAASHADREGRGLDRLTTDETARREGRGLLTTDEGSRREGRGPDRVAIDERASREGRNLPDWVDTDERASVYVLKMGQPVRILELAERMIRIAGYEPGEEIDIEVTGTRPGERLHEILFARDEPMAEIGIDGVMAAKPVFADRARVEMWLKALNRALAADDREAAERIFESAVPENKRRTRGAAPSGNVTPLPTAARGA